MSIRLMSRVGLVTALTAAVLATRSPSFAAVGGGANNIVYVTTTAEHLSAERSAVQVATFSGPDVNTTNIASAQSTNCTGCRTVAVAFQAVLVGGTDRTFTPGNSASATNAGCIGCTTIAFAFQYLVTTPGAAYLTSAGRAAVDAVSARADQVASSDADATTICSELNVLASQFEQAINAPGDVASDGQPLQGFPYLDTNGTCA